MNWNISAWSIRQPIPSIVLFMILIVMGWYSFSNLGIDENPNIDLPFVTITVVNIGAAPAELETQVTRKIEDAVAGVGHIKHITSTVTEGTSSTNIEFELGTNSDRAVNDVRDAVSRIRQQLPQSINEPIIQRLDFAGGPFVTYTVTSKAMTIGQLSWLIDNEISRALLSLAGVGQVQRSGGVDREIHIDLDPTQLESVGVTADMVNTRIAALNINLPGGRGDIGRTEQSIRTLGSAATLEELKNTRIALPSGGWARLDSLGTLSDTTAEPRQRAFLDGKPCVAFQVVRSTGSNLVGVAAAVDKGLETLQKTLPPDVQIHKIRTNATYVLESYHASVDSLLWGAGLAVLVIWLFLRDWWAAIISALAMPMSVIPTFAVMKFFNFTLNNMSLLGLSLVIGILVDDAIVEIENIVRHINMGKKPYDAAIEAADEIGLAVVATTMTIIVVFVPVAFMGGIPGQFFKQFGLTVAVAVFFSLLVARLITPMMAAYWMKAPKEQKGRSLLMRGYDALLSWAMANRFLTVAVALVFFVFGMSLFGVIPSSLVPSADRGETQVSLELPPGSNIEDTTADCLKITNILRTYPEIKTLFAVIGTPSGGGFGRVSNGAVNRATVYVVLQPRTQRTRSQQQIEDDARPRLKTIPGARMTFGNSQGLSGKLTILLASNNGTDLNKAASALLNDMRTVHGLSDVNSDSALKRPEIEVLPDDALMAEQGVSVGTVARTAQIASLGDVDQNLAKFDLPDRQINIRVQLDPRYRDKLETIRNLKVMGASGHMVPLQAVAHVVMGAGESQINRYDRQRQVSISSSLDRGMTLGQALQNVHSLAAYKGMPSTVKDIPSGDAEIQRDVFSGFAAAIGAAILFIFAVLILLFEGFMQPMTIMVSLPLSIGGALMALMLARQPLGMYALIGIVMLMGLATKNAILLVEYCLMAMHKGVPRAEAIIESGEARMRPILMTTVAMIAGMTPIAIGVGAGAEVRAPMALTVIGGLITSTFLTLLVVPVVFSYVDDLKNLVVRRLRKRPT